MVFKKTFYFNVRSDGKWNQFFLFNLPRLAAMVKSHGRVVKVGDELCLLKK